MDSVVTGAGGYRHPPGSARGRRRSDGGPQMAQVRPRAAVGIELFKTGVGHEVGARNLRDEGLPRRVVNTGTSTPPPGPDCRMT